MQVLLWLVPPLGLTALAMLWAAWVGRARDDVVTYDESEEALRAMARGLARPMPDKRAVVPATVERTHGVAIRRTPRGRFSLPGGSR